MTDKEKIKILLKAVKYYADPKNWSLETPDEDSWILERTEMLGDSWDSERSAGAEARHALIKIGEVKPKKKSTRSYNHYEDTEYDPDIGW